MVNLCEKCTHRNVCRYQEPCEECNQFAEEVVLCKDCKCAKLPRNTKYVGTYVRCALYDPAPMMRCDDFCSYGERREGE